MAFVDPDTLPQAPAPKFVNPDDLRGTLGELGAGLTRGAYSIAKSTGETLAGRSELAGEEPGVVAQYLKKVGKEGIEANAPQTDQHGGVTNFVAGIPEAVGGAVPNIASAVAGGAVGSLGGPVGAAAGAGAAGAAQAYAQAYDQALEEGKANGLSGDKLGQFASDKAKNSAVAMGAFSAIGPVGRGGAAVAKSLGGFGERTAAEVGKDLTEKSGLKQFAKHAAVGQAELSGVGAGQAVADNEVNKDAGLPSVSRWDAVKGSLLPGLQAGVGFLPFHALAAHTDVKTALKLQDALQKPDNPFRVAVVKQVAEAMKKEDPDGAQMFVINADQAIKQGKPIGLDDSWTTKAHPSVFPEAKEPDAEATLDNEGGEQPLYPAPGAPEQPTLALPAPGDVAIPTGGPDAASNPLDLSVQHAQQGAVDANDAMWRQRDAAQAEREHLMASGPLGQAAVAGMDSGAVAVKQAERQAELGQPSEGQDKTQEGTPSSANIRAIARNEPVMTLGNAQKMAVAHTEGGNNEWAVVPHPNGGGYTIVPSHLLDPKTAAQYAGIQKGNLTSTRGNTMPFEPEAGAARAKQLTEQTGVEHEVYPHPLAREKVGVRPKQETQDAVPEQSTAGLGAHPNGDEGAGRPVESGGVGRGLEGQEAARQGEAVAAEGEPQVAGARLQQGKLDVRRSATGPVTYDDTPHNSHESREWGWHALQESEVPHAERLIKSLKDSSPIADQLLNGVNIVSYKDGGPMGAQRGKHQIGIRSDILSPAEMDRPDGLRLATSELVHELWHRAETNEDGNQNSINHPAFDIKTDANGGRTAVGGIMQEALEAFKHKDETVSGHMLQYPFDFWNVADHKGLGFGSHDQLSHTIKAEVFAQLGRLYHDNPAQMKLEVPKAYELFKEITDHVTNAKSGVNESVRLALQKRDQTGRVRQDDGSGARAADAKRVGERPAGSGVARPDVNADGRQAVKRSGGGKQDEHVVNIGLNTNDGKGITKEEARAALERAGVKITKESVTQSNTEPTLVATLDRPLTPEEGNRVSEELHQEAIAQRSGTGGDLFGPKAAEWGPWNKDYFEEHPDQKFDVRRKEPEPAPELPAYAKKAITASERQRLTEGASHHVRNRIRKFIKVFEELPSTNEYVHAALAGKAARGWYDRSRRAGEAMYGQDYPRFAALMAALSPQTDVKTNFYNAAKVWAEWNEAGRPKDRESVTKILNRNLTTNEGRLAGKEAMAAYVNNSMRVITHDTGDVQLSGPKVESFRQNLIGNLDEVTNDRHNAAFAGIMQELFSGANDPKLKDQYGKTFGVKDFGYIATSARHREASKALTKVTGELWKPAEVQETVWSFWKTLYELATQEGQTKSALQLIRDGDLTHEMIGNVPDLGRYFDEEKYKGITRGERQGLGGSADEAGRLSESFRGSAKETGPVASSPAILRIAKRLDALIAERKKAAELNAEKNRVESAKEEHGDAYEGDVPEEHADDFDVKFDVQRPEEYQREDGRKVPEKDLLGKVSEGKNAEAEQQFTKAGTPVEERPAEVIPEKYAKLDPVTQSMLRKTGAFFAKRTWRDQWNDAKKEMGLKIIQGVFDQYRPVLEKISKYSYQLLRMASSSDNGLAAMLERGQVMLNSWGALQIKQGTKSFRQIMLPLNNEHSEWFSWMAANRAERLLGEGREHNLTPEEIRAGKALIMETPDRPWTGEGTRAEAYRTAKKEFAEMNKSVLDVGEAAGLFTAEDRKQWESDDYVNFRRAPEGEPAFTPSNLSGMVNAKGVQRLKGGSDSLNDMMSNTMSNWSSMLSSALKNNAAWHTLDEAVDKGFAHRAKEADEGSVYVMQDGKKQYFVVDDPLVMQAIGSLQSQGPKGPVMKVMMAMKHALTVGTTWSPIFRIRHTFREQVTALAANPTTYNFAKNWMDGLKYSAKDNPEWANAQAGGASFHLGLDLEGNRAAYVKRLVSHNIDPKTLVDNEKSAAAMFKHLADWWKETGERSDNITRANLYRQTYASFLEQGHSAERAHFEACYVAKDAMDYSLHGTLGGLRMLTQVIPFMNARLQGIYKLGRGAHEDPKRFAAVIGGVTLATIALSLSQYGDKDIEQASDWDKDNNWLVKVGKTMYRIPKPFEVGAVATVADRLLRLALDGFQPTDRQKFMSRLWSTVGSQLNLNPIPQAVFPALELWANKDEFRGSLIEGSREAGLSSAMRIGPNTSAVAQVASKAMNAATHVVAPNAESLSPEQIDFLVGAYLGWVGQHAVAAADLAVRPMAGLPSKPTRRIDDYFLIGDFAKQLPPAQSQFVSDFYEHATKIQQAMGDLRAYQKTGQTEKAIEQMHDKGDLIGLNSQYMNTIAEIGKINSRIRYVQMMGKSDDEKRADIDSLTQLKNRLAEVAEKARSQRLNK